MPAISPSYPLPALAECQGAAGLERILRWFRNIPKLIGKFRITSDHRVPGVRWSFSEGWRWFRIIPYLIGIVRNFPAMPGHWRRSRHSFSSVVKDQQWTGDSDQRREKPNGQSSCLQHLPRNSGGRGQVLWSPRQWRRRALKLWA
jgi:hypothetical protein